MQDDDVRDQIEALRSEVRALSNAFMDLRQEDVRRVYCNQIRSILVERVDRFLSKSEIDDKAEYEARLVGLIDHAITAYMRGGKEEVTRFLDGYESDLINQRPPRNRSSGASFTLNLIREMRDYFETSEAILERSGARGRLIGPSMSIKKASVSPIEVEKALDPLANSWRVNILMTLSKDDESLAALSKALGLKKGHLQFHLKCLLDADYICYDRKSRLYSITEKGTIVLDGVTKLIDRLALV